MSRLCACLLIAGWTSVAAVAAPPSRSAAESALRRACTFYHEQCSKHGGYVWRYSRDLTLSEGEAETGEDTVWVQPPGTPTVGLAFVAAYDATGERQYFEWARETARCLVKGQLQSGGWYYSIHFDPSERAKWGYRDNERFRASTRKKNRTNVTTLDDDTTPAALRCLMQVDKRLNFEDDAIHEAALFTLTALLTEQYPNGGWYQNWDNYPQLKSARDYPVIPASYAKNWSRKWLNDWPGRYYTNDNVTGMMIETLLQAWEVYGDDRFRDAALRTGDFLLLAQMPDPQPGWAQQYDDQMHPCWDRKMEPPAISSHESEEVIQALMRLAEATGETKYLEPIPRAIAYFRSSLLPDGRMPRFYELETNRPLYETDDYQLTYNLDDAPSHYGWVFDAHWDELQREYQRVKSSMAATSQSRQSRTARRAETHANLAAEVQRVIAALDDRGAWVDKRGMRGFRKASQEGVMQSETFAANVETLCRFLSRATAPGR